MSSSDDPLTLPLRGSLPLPNGERVGVRGSGPLHAARCAILLAALIALAGCGFRPLYAPRGPQDWDPDLAAISVSVIRDRPGQILALALRESLNPGGNSVPTRWRLDTLLSVTRGDLGIQRNATTTGSEVFVSATFTLTDIKTGKPVYTSSSRANADYDRLVDAYATQVGGDDAQDRALRQVADEMALRLALFVRQQRNKPASQSSSP
jgi:LPS-assembly lipoprotein